MKVTRKVYSLVIGIDVAKAKLDIAFSSESATETIKHTRTEIVQNLLPKISDRNSTLVVVEATGGYEGLLVDVLHEHQIPVAVINPRRIRDFAKGVGIDAKTDPIDAKVISYYGEVVQPTPDVPKSEQEKN